MYRATLVEAAVSDLTRLDKPVGRRSLPATLPYPGDDKIRERLRDELGERIHNAEE